MATQVQFRGGTTSEHSTFTGVAREVTVDTTKKTVVVHDGSTAGGIPLAKESAATSAVAITGGTINGTTIGATTASTGKFTSVTNTGLTSGRVMYATTGGLVTDSASLTFDGTTVTATKFAGALNGTVGATTASTGAFTTLSTSSTTTFSGLTASTALALDASKNVVSVTNTGTGNNVLSASPTLTGTIAGASLSLSSLTSGRVTYATTSGLLTDSANLTFNGTTLATLGSAATATNGITLGGTTTNWNRVYISNTTGDAYIGVDNSTGGGIGTLPYAAVFGTTTGTTALQLVTAGTAKLTILTGGNVGIGTSSPATALDVNGQITASNTIFSNGGFSGQGAYVQRNSTGGGTLGSLLSSGSVTFETNATERMRIDSSGNVGIGTSSPAAKLEVFNTTTGSAIRASVNDGAGASSFGYGFYVKNAGYDLAQILAYYNSSSGGGSGGLIFNTRNATLNEAMRIDYSGNLLVGATSVSTTTAGIALQKSQGANIWAMNIAGAASTSSSYAHYVYSTTASAYRFLVDYAGTIFATSTSITAISDQSLKTNIKPLETGLAEVMRLQPRRFDWINGDATNIAGFIAQEVETVLPDLVSDFKYNDVETKKAVKMGDMLPTLVKAIQEQQALIESLTTRLTNLENK